MPNGTAALVRSLKALDQATLSPAVVRASGAGKAYQSVAQSAAIAVQDATDVLRNISAVGTTVMGIALVQFLATEEPKYLKAIEAAESMMTNGVKYFQQVGMTAATVLNGFPDGS